MRSQSHPSSSKSNVQLPRHAVANGSSPPSLGDAGFDAMVQHHEKQKLKAADELARAKLRAQVNAEGDGDGNDKPLLSEVVDLEHPDLAWGAGSCAVEVFGSNTRRTRKAVYNWRTDVRDGLRDDPNYPNPGLVFFKRRNAVVLSRRAFRAYVANLIKGGRS